MDEKSSLDSKLTKVQIKKEKVIIVSSILVLIGGIISFVLFFFIKDLPEAQRSKEKHTLEALVTVNKVFDNLTNEKKEIYLTQLERILDEELFREVFQILDQQYTTEDPTVLKSLSALKKLGPILEIERKKVKLDIQEKKERIKNYQDEVPQNDDLLDQFAKVNIKNLYIQIEVLSHQLKTLEELTQSLEISK